MIHYKVGDLLQNVKTGVIMHGTNCLGVMGAGIARGIKDRFPDTFKEYQTHCRLYGETNLGHMLVTPGVGLKIINAFTQASTGGRKAMSYDAIDEIFHELYCSGAYDDINKEIHTVKIGAGLGGGNWKVIEQIILTYLPESCNLYVWDFK